MVSNPTPNKPQKAEAEYGAGYHVKVVRRDLAHEDRKRKRRLKKAVMKLQSTDKHRDIDYNMDLHVKTTKANRIDIDLH